MELNALITERLLEEVSAYETLQSVGRLFGGKASIYVKRGGIRIREEWKRTNRGFPDSEPEPFLQVMYLLSNGRIASGMESWTLDEYQRRFRTGADERPVEVSKALERLIEDLKKLDAAF